MTTQTQKDAIEELVTDPVLMSRILYPLNLFGRMYDARTVHRLLQSLNPTCPFTRKNFTIADVLKPTLFERRLFDAMDQPVCDTERNEAKHHFILFARQYEWYVEAAELGDLESMVPAALQMLEINRTTESRRYALKAAQRGNMFGWDVLGHIAMLEKKYADAHQLFVRCWESPLWNSKGRTAYFIAECYFERDLFKKALHWVNRAKCLNVGDTESYTLCAQIFYLQNQFDRCIMNAAIVKNKNFLAAFIYAMCALRKVGRFKHEDRAVREGSELMHQLRSEGYIEAGRFLTDAFVFDTVRNARRNASRPKAWA